MTFLDLCAGIGGFSLGFERAGMMCKGQVEKNGQCIAVLEKRFPGVPKYRDLLSFADEWDGHADVFAFGDPCPKHSRARSNGESSHPDLSGYCLALVGRFRPRWVVRENVPAPTVAHFAACLEALGYGTVVVRMDSATHTGQSRQRDYIVGLYQAGGPSVRGLFPHFPDGPWTGLPLPVVQCVGYAADEQKRADKHSQKDIPCFGGWDYPLIRWGVTEQQALEYCVDRGLDWGGLYDIFDRVSCWCCPLGGISQAEKIYRNFPGMWQRMLEMESWLPHGHKGRKYTGKYSVSDLGRRFAAEDNYKSRMLKLPGLQPEESHA